MNKTWLRTLETELDRIQLDRHGEGGRRVIWVRVERAVVEERAECEAVAEEDGFEIAGGIRRHAGTARKGLGLMTEATFKRVPIAVAAATGSLDETVRTKST